MITVYLGGVALLLLIALRSRSLTSMALSHPFIAIGLIGGWPVAILALVAKFIVYPVEIRRVSSRDFHRGDRED